MIISPAAIFDENVGAITFPPFPEGDATSQPPPQKVYRIRSVPSLSTSQSTVKAVDKEVFGPPVALYRVSKLK